MSTKPGIVVEYFYPGSAEPNLLYTLPAGTVTGINWTGGRANITDQWQGGSAVIFGRSPASLTQAPVIGQACRITVGTAGYSRAKFYGFISDYRIIYGLLPAYDTFEITLETVFGVTGRKNSTITAVANATTRDVVVSVNALFPTAQIGVGSGYASSTSAQTITGQVSNALVTAMNTEGGYVYESGYDDIPPAGFTPTSVFTGRYNDQFGTTLCTFSDVTSDTPSDTMLRYSEIEFRSAAYNLGTQVTVSASGLADQSAGSGTYAQNISTINSTTSDALNLANYLQVKYNYSSTVPYSITTTGSMNTTSAIFVCATGYVGRMVTVKFRGTTYSCIIEGVQFSANATDWHLQYTLSASVQTAFLRLDNPTLGTLNNNRLG